MKSEPKFEIIIEGASRAGPLKLSDSSINFLAALFGEKLKEKIEGGKTSEQE